MSKKPYRKEKKESFFQRLSNLVLTVLIAIAIGSQMCTAANNNLRFVQVSDAHFSTFEENTSYKFLKNSPELLEDAIFQINTSFVHRFHGLTCLPDCYYWYLPNKCHIFFYPKN